MAKADNMYIANLAFLLNYTDGFKKDEIEEEIFKIAFQSKEQVHYDRIMGGGFPDLEQDQNNAANGLMFSANLVESIYRVNQEHNFEPYIVVGFFDINIKNGALTNTDEYIVEIKYRILSNLKQVGAVSI